jgi:lysozyme family protein
MGGATKYLQEGLKSLGQSVAVDGAIGPKTLSAIGSVNPKDLMIAASQAQLNDERARAAADPRRRKFIVGLENRINNRLSAFGGG